MNDLPCKFKQENGDVWIEYDLTFPISTGKTLPGSDCPAEKCSVCGELFEEGSRFCSWCGRMIIRNA
jgi:hypothetical protein